MANEIDQERGDAFYGEFYRTGGWKYSFWREFFWHRRNVFRRFQLRRRSRALEVACGTGFHTNLFNRMGLRCTGVDRSEVGIQWAKQHYPKRNFCCCDFRAMPFEDRSFDVIIARGLSYYHYDLLSDESLGATETLLKHLKPGGTFAMLIITDLSGRREPDQVWHNTLEDYRAHFSTFGCQSSVEWVDGMAICGVVNRTNKKAHTFRERIGDSLVAATS